jgi:hypothetical protein
MTQPKRLIASMIGGVALLPAAARGWLAPGGTSLPVLLAGLAPTQQERQGRTDRDGRKEMGCAAGKARAIRMRGTTGARSAAAVSPARSRARSSWPAGQRGSSAPRFPNDRGGGMAQSGHRRARRLFRKLARCGAQCRRGRRHLNFGRVRPGNRRAQFGWDSAAHPIHHAAGDELWPRDLLLWNYPSESPELSVDDQRRLLWHPGRQRQLLQSDTRHALRQR